MGIKEDYEQAYQDAYQGWSGFQATAEENLRVYLSDQLTPQEKQWLKDGNRNAYVFNKVARFMDLISGFEIRDRHILKIVGTGGEDDKVSSQFTGLIMNAMNKGGYDVLSDAFLYGPLITGANLIELFPDRKGDLKFSRLGYNEFLLDPNFTHLDLSDCEHIMRGKWMHPNQVKKLHPTLSDREFDRQPSTSTRWNYLPGMKRMYGKELRLYEEYWYRTTRRVRMIVIRDQNQSPIGLQDYNQALAEAQRQGVNRQDAINIIKDSPNLSTFTDTIDTVKLAALLDGEVIYDGANPTGLDEFNYVLNAGIFAPEYVSCSDRNYKLQGLMLRAKDPQRATNRRVNQIMDIIEKRIQEGIVAKKDDIVNWQSVYKSGQGLRFWIKSKRDQPAQNYVHQLQPPDIQPGMFQFYDLLGKEAIEILGLNEEILGSDTGEIPGVLGKMRTGAALTGLQPIYKNFRICKKHLGVKQMKYMQKNYRPGKVQRILQEPPAPDFYKTDLTQYDCTPTEGLLTDNQRQLAYAELRMLKKDFPDLGITGDILLSLLPLQLPDKIKQMIAQNQRQQVQLQQKAVEQEERGARLQEAVTASEIAQTRERMTESAENRSSMALDRAKTAETISKIQNDKVLNLLDRAIELEKIEVEKAKVNQSKG
jgi:hypothetical protein